MAGGFPGRAIGVQQRAQLVGDERDRHHRIAHAAGEFERVRGGQRGDIEFRPGLLRRARQRGGVLDRVKAPAMGDIVARQQQVDLLQTFAKPRHRLVGRTVKAAELVRQKRPREADIEPAAAQRIEHGDLAGQFQRMVEGRQHRAGHQPRPPRALRRRREKDDRVGAVAAVMVKIMLDDPDMRIAQLVRFLGEIERLRKIGLRRFLLWPHIGEELHAELHRRSTRVSAPPGRGLRRRTRPAAATAASGTGVRGRARNRGCWHRPPARSAPAARLRAGTRRKPYRCDWPGSRRTAGRPAQRYRMMRFGARIAPTVKAPL